MPGMPGYQPGMVPGMMPGMPGYQQGLVPGMMVPGAQMGMMVPGMQQGQYQITSGINEYSKVNEATYEEMLSVLRNFEGYDYYQTCRTILGDDVYFSFDQAFNNLKSKISKVYKINEATINQAVKKSLDRDTKRQKELLEKSLRKTRRSRALEKQQREMEEAQDAFVSGRTADSSKLTSRPNLDKINK